MSIILLYYHPTYSTIHWLYFDSNIVQLLNDFSFNKTLTHILDKHSKFFNGREPLIKTLELLFSYNIIIFENQIKNNSYENSQN